MEELERGREAYRKRAWLTAYKAFSLADEAAPLGAQDLELLATSAYLIGRNDDGVGALDRAHHVYLDAGEPVCAIWLGFGLIDAGEKSPYDDFTPATTTELDLDAAGVGAVVWATGYQLDFGWVDLPVLDEWGIPATCQGRHHAPWAVRRRAALAAHRAVLGTRRSRRRCRSHRRAHRGKAGQPLNTAQPGAVRAR